MGQYANATTYGFDITKLLAATPVYVAVAEITSVDFSGITADALETTAHGDTWRQRIAGLKDLGTASLTIRFGAETHAALLDAVGIKCAHRVAFPLEDATNTTPLSIAADGIITSLGVASPFDGLLEASMTVQFSGAPTIVDEAA